MTRTNKRNLAARMGRWSAAHWKNATFGWLAFVFVAFALGAMGGVDDASTRTRPGPESPAACRRSSTTGSSSPPARAS